MTRFQYVFVPRRRHPVTVAYRARRTSETQIEVTLGAAFCSNRDRFTRPLGREIAEGRLLRGKPILLFAQIGSGETYGEAIVRLINSHITEKFGDVMARFCQRQMD